MSKRERKRQNRLEKIERIQAAQRREARMRFAKRLATFFALFAAVLAVIWWQNKDSSSSSTASSTSSASSSTTSVTPATLAAAGIAEGDKYYLATITTEKGEMVAALDSTKAPKGVKQFVTLAKAGFYDDLTFHRAVNGFMIQGGDPKGDGTGGVSGSKTGGAPTSGVGEAPANNSYSLGDLAYAKGSGDPAFTFGSQFFVVTAADGANGSLAPEGNPQYGWFGRVVSGIDVAKTIEASKVNGESLTPKIKITSVTISKQKTMTAVSATSSTSSAAEDSSSSSATSSSSSAK
ncbi:MAG: peptidylprolyl isomerase [Acidimicrobiia bacterium]